MNTTAEETPSSKTFSLDNFEGPLDLLLHLVQNKEIDIYSVAIQEVTQQYLDFLKPLIEFDIDKGAEFLATTASLILIKSKMLLPKEERVIEEDDSCPRFEIIEKLLDYFRFKQMAKVLNEKEEQQQSYHARGVTFELPKESSTIMTQTGSLSDLTKHFCHVLERARLRKTNPIYDDMFTVADKIKFLRNLLREKSELPFEMVFSSSLCKEELITTFLALLEMMKSQKITVTKIIINDKRTFKLEWNYDND